MTIYISGCAAGSRDKNNTIPSKLRKNEGNFKVMISHLFNIAILKPSSKILK
jgi:hypothetical protein